MSAFVGKYFLKIRFRIVYQEKTLKGVLGHVTIKRNVSIKEIVRECGCSRPHFNKIISGERKPGKELKSKLANALEISETELSYLLQLSADPCGDVESDILSTGEKDTNITLLQNRYLIAIAVILFIVSIYMVGFYKPHLKNIGSSISRLPKISGDSSSFVKDISIPDGSYIPVNTKFSKTWRIKNTGVEVWDGRYLKRTTPPSPLVCYSDMIVPIKRTLPGEEVDITVLFTAPYLPGSCRTDWKMVDKFGNLFFPNLHGLYSIVNIVEKK